MKSKIVSGFLWFPKTIDGVRKWFVYARWEEERHKLDPHSIFNPFGIGDRWSDWEPVCWIDLN